MTAPAWHVGLCFLIGGVMTLTPTALLMSLIGPRPPLRQLARRPGFAASLAGTATLALGLGLLAIAIIAIIRLIKSGRVTASGRPALTPNPGWWLWVEEDFGGIAGLAVIGAWLMLAISGRRRPARHWLDYLGRAIGAVWVLLFVAHCCRSLTHAID